MNKAEAELLCELFKKYDPDYEVRRIHETVENEDGIEGEIIEEYYLVFKPNDITKKAFLASNSEFIVRDSKSRLPATFLKEWAAWKLLREHNL